MTHLIPRLSKSPYQLSSHPQLIVRPKEEQKAPKKLYSLSQGLVARELAERLTELVAGSVSQPRGQKKSKVKYGMKAYRDPAKSIEAPPISSVSQLKKSLKIDDKWTGQESLHTLLETLDKDKLQDPKTLSYIARIADRHGPETSSAIWTRFSDFATQCKSTSRRKGVLKAGLHDLAFPSHINQENRKTCGPTAAQMMLAVHRPAEYTRILSGLALGKDVTMKGGKKLHPNTVNYNDADDKRSLTCKILQDSFSKHIGCKTVDQGTTALGVRPLIKQLYGNSNLQSDTFVGHSGKAMWQYMEDDIVQGWPAVVGFNGHWVLATGIDRTGSEPKVILNTWGRQHSLGKAEFARQTYAVINYDDKGSDNRQVPANTKVILGDR